MNFKKYLALGTALTLTLLAGCGSSGSGDDQIVIYSNADEEAITAMENALDAGGYEGKYIVQTYGTSELGGDQTENGVFVCFAPYDDPEIAIAIVVEKGGSGSLLANAAVDIINAWFTRDGTGATAAGEDALMR